MSSRQLLLSAVLLLCLLLVSSNAETYDDVARAIGGGANRRLLQTIDCGARCKERCSKNSRPNRCLRACGTCCQRCNCVPPGTSGNQEACGTCYTSQRTHGNRLKCP